MFADVLVPQILNWEYPGCMSEEQWPPGVGVLGAGQISQAAPRRQGPRRGRQPRGARHGAFRVFVKKLNALV